MNTTCPKAGSATHGVQDGVTVKGARVLNCDIEYGETKHSECRQGCSTVDVAKYQMWCNIIVNVIECFGGIIVMAYRAILSRVGQHTTPNR